MLSATFRQLEVFAAVVETGSFVAASGRLNISQPAVSNHIRSLELQFGCELLHRQRGTTARLTDDGRRLYERAVQLLLDAEEIANDMPRRRGTANRQRITVATTRYGAKFFLNRSITEFMRRCPNVQLVVDSGAFESIVRNVQTGQADFGYFVSFGPVPDLASQVIAREPRSLFVAPDHPLAGREALDVAEVCQHPFLLPLPSTFYGTINKRALASVGLTRYEILFSTQDSDMMLELALAGKGVSYMYDRVVDDYLKTGRLVRVSFATPPLDIRQAVSAQRYQVRAGDLFASLVRRHLAEICLPPADA